LSLLAKNDAKSEKIMKFPFLWKWNCQLQFIFNVFCVILEFQWVSSDRNLKKFFDFNKPIRAI